MQHGPGTPGDQADHSTASTRQEVGNGHTWSEITALAEKIPMRWLIAKAARAYKGPDYTIDPAIGSWALLNFATRRGAALLRCMLRGIKFSLNPRELVFVGRDVRIHNRRGVKFGRGVTLGDHVLINGLARKGITIGDSVNIGAYTIVQATSVLWDVGEGCSIGARSGLGEFSYIGAAGGVWIGEDVIMGQRVSFHSENHHFQRIDIPVRAQGIERKGITIESDCWIGANVVFLDGAHVGKGCVIGAGAVVRGVIPPYSIAVGVPARVIRSRKTEPPDMSDPQS